MHSVVIIPKMKPKQIISSSHSFLSLTCEQGALSQARWAGVPSVAGSITMGILVYKPLGEHDLRGTEQEGG
jgi:hypothetical protein